MSLLEVKSNSLQLPNIRVMVGFDDYSTKVRYAFEYIVVTQSDTSSTTRANIRSASTRTCTFKYISPLYRLTWFNSQHKQDKILLLPEI